MKTFFLLFFAFYILISAPLLQAQDALMPTAPGLFDSQEPLEFTLVSEMKLLFKDIGDQREYHPATLTYVGGDGTPITLDAELRTRGNFRRQKNVCNVPPIHVKFKKETTAGTLFANQKKLKLVTVCQAKKELYEQNLLLEYLTYRTYNLLTDSSFRVRLARIRYIDSDNSLDTLVRYSFFIEDEDAMAARMGSQILEAKNVHPAQTHQYAAARMSMFQYMIGNTDWSIPSLHNVRLVGPNGMVPPVPVPYDFDWCGAISAPYAKPNPKLGIPTVESRLYRGFCRTREEFEQVMVGFRAQKDAIYALYQQCGMLDEKYRSKVLSYYDEFFEIINSEKRIEREIMNECRTGF